jgi:hypothetical protein
VQSCRIAATKKATLSKGDGSSCFLNVPAVEGVRLVLFFPYFLTVTLASERFFNALFLAWLEVERTHRVRFFFFFFFFFERRPMQQKVVFFLFFYFLILG